jgi:hypothetical protein
LRLAKQFFGNTAAKQDYHSSYCKNFFHNNIFSNSIQKCCPTFYLGKQIV